VRTAIAWPQAALQIVAEIGMLGTPVSQELFERQVLPAAHKIEPVDHAFPRDKLKLIVHTDTGIFRHLFK
jgi:hypothetical protein